MLRIKTKKKIGYQISDIGKGGKEYNIKDYGYSPNRKKERLSGYGDQMMYKRVRDNCVHPKKFYVRWSADYTSCGICGKKINRPYVEYTDIKTGTRKRLRLAKITQEESI